MCATRSLTDQPGHPDGAAHSAAARPSQIRISSARSAPSASMKSSIAFTFRIAVKLDIVMLCRIEIRCKRLAEMAIQVGDGQAPSLRAEHVAQTRTALLEAGRRLFGERGFAGTSGIRASPRRDDGDL